MGSLSIWHWAIVLAIVMLVFGTGKLKNLGGDLGSAIRDFKRGVREGEEAAGAVPAAVDAGGQRQLPAHADGRPQR